MSGLAIILFLIFLVIHLGYWGFYYRYHAGFSYSIPEEKLQLPGVSVIICYKNAGTQIIQTVQSVLNQNYPEFEVIAVDDFSSDQGPEQLEQIHDFRLKTLSAKADRPGKKYALKEGISHARYDWVALTDADCIPDSQDWLSKMFTACRRQNADIVLGYSPMTEGTHLVSRFSAFETVLTALQYFSFALSGHAYMGVGRNLLYRKEIFTRYADDRYFSIPAGDDDLLIQRAAPHCTVGICTDKSAWVSTRPQTTWLAFLKQKSRHVAVSGYYRPIYRWWLGLFSVSMIMVYVSGAMVLCYDLLPWYGLLIIFLLKWRIQAFCHARFFQYFAPKMFMEYPLYEAVYSGYLMLLGPVSFILKNKKW